MNRGRRIGSVVFYSVLFDPASVLSAKALFATLYDLCLSFICSKCVCLYNLICCSLLPLPLGEV